MSFDRLTCHSYRELGEILAPDTGNEGRKYRDRRDVGTGYEGRGVPGLKGENSLKSAVKLDTCKPVKHIQSLLDKEHKHGSSEMFRKPVRLLFF